MLSIPARATSTRCSSGEQSTSLPGRNIATRRARIPPSSTWGPGSEYYELALYKLGWTLYKQEFYEEALHRYFALLDYKVASGYDFDSTHEEEEERRVEDTFQVISLSLSNLGGTEVIGEYFSANGHRSYEDRVYRYFGDFYLAKLRYNDAATVYKSFVALYPLHPVAPHFSMRTIEIYEAGGFPKLVLDSKKEFATRYGLQADYWRHFDVGGSPQVLSYLKSNLKDLANHYHAQYQDAGKAQEKPANYAEASRWYREFLDSFHGDARSAAAQLSAGRSLCARTVIRQERPESTNARHTTIPRTRKRRRPDMPRSTRTASTSRR